MSKPASRSAWLVFALTLPVYLATMNRTIGFVDRGELAAVAWTFGIPHATGYPTLMLIAGALAHLVPLRPVLVLNAFAAVLVAAGAAVLMLLYDRVLASVDPRLTAGMRAICATLGALFTALTLTWWQQANGFEVYALHALLMPLVVLLFLRWVDATATGAAVATSTRATRAGFAFALVTGLAFTNHMTTVLLAPGLIVAAIARLGIGRHLWRSILGLALPFALGLLPYAWLPFRSAMGPRFDWGATHTLRGFLHHISGGDYRGWMFSDLSTFETQLRYVLWRIPWDFAWVGLIVAALGTWTLARRAPALAAMAGLFVLAGVAFATGYKIMDIESYLLTPMLGLGLLFTAGLARLHERLGARAALGFGAILVVTSAALHARSCDESGNRLAEQLVADYLGPLPANAVLFTPLWDYCQSAAFYYQEVEGFRRDVLVVNPEMLRRAWYLRELERRAPDLAAQPAAELARFREALVPVEQGRSFSGSRTERVYRDYVNAFIAGAMRDRPVFVTGKFDALSDEWHRVPYHLAMRLTPGSEYVAEPPWTYRHRPWVARMDGYVAMTSELYGEARVGRAAYEAHYGRHQQARRLLESISAFDPRIRIEQVGPLPLGTHRMVLRCARFFRTAREQLRAPVERSPAG